MAERLSPEEKAAIKALVGEVHQTLGGGNWAKIARAAEVSEYSLGEWRRGEGSPSALNLMKLLRAAGVLGDDFGIRPPAVSQPRGRDPEAEGLVAEVGEMIDEAHQDLAGRLDRIERQVAHVRHAVEPQPSGEGTVGNGL